MANSETPLGDLVGTDIGPYKLVRRLGVGGMAETFEAIRRGPSDFTQRVCLKLVLPFFRDDPNFIRLFEREARLAAQLRHRNIVGVIDFGEIEGKSYMALELVDGADLRMLLDQRPRQRLSAEYVALIGLELADALHHAHSPIPGAVYSESESGTFGIVHRDISPSNVLISRQGEVLLTDFGVAKAISGASRQQSAVKGKVPYMSPEQLRAEGLDGRADLFALGVVLFEALAGERPYDGAHDPATIMVILSGDRPRLGTLVPEAPPRLCEVIDSLLEPDRNNRPENAGALIELLDEFAPSPRIRRSLGAMAVEARQATTRDSTEISAVVADGPTKMGVDGDEDTGVKRAGSAGSADPLARSSSPSGDAAVADVDEATHGEEAQAGRWSRRDLAKIMVGLVLAVGGAGAVGLALWPIGLEEEDPEVDLDAGLEVASEDSVDEPVAEPAVEAAEDTKDAADGAAAAAAAPPADAPPIEPEPKAVAPAAARLSVVVFPWGSVWVNGKSSGSAPLRDKSLKPGRYKISVGQGSPTKTKTVRLRAGERKTIHFDLTQ